MNFAEAAKSRRPFRRAGWKHWIVYSTSHYVYEWDHGESIASDMRPEWFDADDWEIEEVRVTITREQFNAAWDNALLRIAMRLDRDTLAEELGL